MMTPLWAGQGQRRSGSEKEPLRFMSASRPTHPHKVLTDLSLVPGAASPFFSVPDDACDTAPGPEHVPVFSLLCRGGIWSDKGSFPSPLPPFRTHRPSVTRPLLKHLSVSL
jgi:hypothetical protein